MVDNTKLERRIAGREAAAEVISLLHDELRDPDFAQAVIGQIEMWAGIGQEQSGPPPEDPIPYAQLEGFRVPFGVHGNKRFREIPLDYLDWLCKVQEEFLRDLQAYLKHPKTRRENNGSD